jgi:hypothetical protein
MQAVTQTRPSDRRSSVVPSVDRHQLPVAIAIPWYCIHKNANSLNLAASVGPKTDNTITILSLTTIPVVHINLLNCRKNN